VEAMVVVLNVELVLPDKHVLLLDSVLPHLALLPQEQPELQLEPLELFPLELLELFPLELLELFPLELLEQLEPQLDPLVSSPLEQLELQLDPLVSSPLELLEQLELQLDPLVSSQLEVLEPLVAFVNVLMEETVDLMVVEVHAELAPDLINV